MPLPATYCRRHASDQLQAGLVPVSVCELGGYRGYISQWLIIVYGGITTSEWNARDDDAKVENETVTEMSK